MKKWKLGSKKKVLLISILVLPLYFSHLFAGRLSRLEQGPNTESAMQPSYSKKIESMATPKKGVRTPASFFDIKAGDNVCIVVPFSNLQCKCGPAPSRLVASWQRALHNVDGAGKLQKYEVGGKEMFIHELEMPTGKMLMFFGPDRSVCDVLTELARAKGLVK